MSTFEHRKKGPDERQISSEVINRRMTDVWEVCQSMNANDQAGHPSAFPVALSRNAILLYADAVVFDPFGGSGSTLMACEITGRKAVVMEIDPNYCDIIIKRWENFTAKKATLTPKKIIHRVVRSVGDLNTKMKPGTSTRKQNLASAKA